MRASVNVSLFCLLVAFLNASATAQFSLPNFGTKSKAGNDQKAAQLLHDKLPLALDANSAYPTVPDRDMLGGPFRGQVLHITLDTLTKPLPPGDYVLPMTFFCSEYSIHRPGAGTAYVLAPARGTSARAISTLLWRGMLAGYKPQELQSVSWAIQGSVPYGNMPQKYRNTIDQLIPDMKNQVNGQAFLDIEDGFQGKVNRYSRAVSGKVNQGLGKVAGDHIRFDLKVDVELNDSFTRLGRLGRSAIDGENIAGIVQNLTLSDSQREQTLYAGQGTQAPPLPAANGPWSVVVPGVAYMRFLVHGGNLQGDNTMQIRILKLGAAKAALSERPKLILAQYTPTGTSTPSLTTLFNGNVNEATVRNCGVSSASPPACALRALSLTGLDAYSVGLGSQSPIMVPSEPFPSTSGIVATPRERIAEAGEHRTTIGVGEIVDLSGGSDQNSTWQIMESKNAGCLVSAGSIPNGSDCPSTANGMSVTFTASNQGGAIKLSLQNHQGSPQSISLSVVKPQKAIWLPLQPPSIEPIPSPTDALANNTGSFTFHPFGACVAGEQGVYFIAPDQVSFSRIRFSEGNLTPTWTGGLQLDKQFQSLFAGKYHCGETVEKWCGYQPVSSFVLDKVGSRAKYGDKADWSLQFRDKRGNSYNACTKGASGAGTIQIPVRFSVRRPDSWDPSSEEVVEEKAGGTHWSNDELFKEEVVQRITLANAVMNAQKGEIPAKSVAMNSPTTYIACEKSPDPTGRDTDLYLILGAPAHLEAEIRSAAKSGRITLKACKEMCLWNGTCQRPE